jgi:multimeric flavodoxin WrbA
VKKLKVLAINGSPRKNSNTAILLKNALEGAASQGAETELVHLYALNYKGCNSCFACKLKDGKSYGKCAIKDGLTPILEKIPEIDAFILGSPIYFGNVTGEMRSFMERLLFPYVVYDKNYSSLFPKKIKTGWIYTMNIPESRIKESGYESIFQLDERLMTRTFGSSESLLVTDTYQFNDYSKYVSSLFDPELKARRRQEVFPADCKKAFEMGSRMAKKDNA